MRRAPPYQNGSVSSPLGARGRRVPPLPGPIAQHTAAAFVITNVSQTAGKAAGGTQIVVTATGIVGTPTSTLGTVSNVSGTQFTITTNAHAAGAVTWTATCNGQTSSIQTYTYLAAPSYIGINPTHGPQTLTLAGVVVNVSGLPANNSTGCPVTVSFGANLGTSTAVVDSTHVSSTQPISTSGAGAVNVTVSVDGVTTTGSLVYTYDPPPSELNASETGTLGGTGTIKGANFVATPTASVNINGTPTALTIAFIDPETLGYTLPGPGPYTAGLWPCTVTNPDGQSDTETVFEILNAKTLQTIFGSNLVQDCALSNATVVSGAVSVITDSSSFGNNATQTTPANRGTYNATSSSFNSQPSMTVASASSQYMKTASFNWGTSPSAMTFIAAIKPGSAGASSKYIADYPSAGDPSFQFNASGQIIPEINGNGSASAATANTACIVVAKLVQSGGTINISVSLNNGTPVTTSTGGSLVFTGQDLTLFAKSTLAQFFDGEVAEWAFVNRDATAQETSDAVTFLNLKYQVTPPPTFIASTNVPAGLANGFVRIQGTNFLAGAMVTINGNALTPSVITSSVIEVNTLPSMSIGTYSLTVQNSDGQGFTQASGINVVAQDTDPMSMVVSGVQLGPKVILWCEGTATVAGGTVSLLTDLSCNIPGTSTALGGWVQATGGSQPAWNASDATFNGQPSIQGNGSSAFMSIATTPQGVSPASAIWEVSVFSLTSTTGTQTFISPNNSNFQTYVVSGVPRQWTIGHAAIWGATLSTNTPYFVVGRTSGSAPYTMGIDVGNGSEVTATNAGALTYSLNAPYFLLAATASTQFFAGKSPFHLLANADISAFTTKLKTYCAKFGV